MLHIKIKTIDDYRSVLAVLATAVIFTPFSYFSFIEDGLIITISMLTLILLFYISLDRVQNLIKSSKTSEGSCLSILALIILMFIYFSYLSAGLGGIGKEGLQMIKVKIREKGNTRIYKKDACVLTRSTDYDIYESDENRWGQETYNDKSELFIDLISVDMGTRVILFKKCQLDLYQETECRDFKGKKWVVAVDD